MADPKKLKRPNKLDQNIKANIDISELLGSNEGLDKINYLLAFKYLKIRKNILNAVIKKTQGGKLTGLKLGKEIKISELLGEPPQSGILFGLKWLRTKNIILKKVAAAAKDANFEFGKEIDINDILGSAPEQDFITKTRFFLIRQKLLSKISKAVKDFDAKSMLPGIAGINPTETDEIDTTDISSTKSISSAEGLSTDESLEELRGIHTGIDNIYDHLLDSKGDKLKDRENAREQIARNERRHDELLNAAKGGSGFLGGGMGGSGGSGGDSGEKGFLRNFLEFKFADKLLRGKGGLGKGGLLKNAGSRALGLGRAAVPAAGAALTKGGALLSAAATSTPGMMVGAGLGGYAVGTGINNIPKLLGSEDRFSDMMGRPLGNMLAKARGVDMSGPLSEEKILELHRQGLNANKPITEKRGIFGFRKKVITGYEKLERAGEAENSKGPSVSPTESITGKKTAGEANYKKALENREKAINDLKSFKDETVEGKDYEMIERPQGYRGVYMGTSFDDDGNVEKNLIRKYKNEDVQKKFIELENASNASYNKVDSSEIDMLIDAGLLNKKYGGKDGSRRILFRQNLELARRRYVKSKNIDIYAGTERGSQEYYRAQADDISYGGRDAIQRNILGIKPTENMTGQKTESASNSSPTETATGKKTEIKSGYGMVNGQFTAVIDGMPYQYGEEIHTKTQNGKVVKDAFCYIKKGAGNLDDDPENHRVDKESYANFVEKMDSTDWLSSPKLSAEEIRNMKSAPAPKQAVPKELPVSVPNIGMSTVETKNPDVVPTADYGLSSGREERRRKESNNDLAEFEKMNDSDYGFDKIDGIGYRRKYNNEEKQKEYEALLDDVSLYAPSDQSMEDRNKVDAKYYKENYQQLIDSGEHHNSFDAHELKYRYLYAMGHGEETFAGSDTLDEDSMYQTMFLMDQGKLPSNGNFTTGMSGDYQPDAMMHNLLMKREPSKLSLDSTASIPSSTGMELTMAQKENSQLKGEGSRGGEQPIVAPTNVTNSNSNVTNTTIAAPPHIDRTQNNFGAVTLAY